VELRDALAALVSEAGGSGGIRGGAELQRALGISNTLAWQIYRIANAPDPLAEGCTVPRHKAMKRMLDAASERGISERVIRRVEAAVAAFEQVVETHARNRREFDAIVSTIGADGSNAIDIDQRRQAFFANSHIWGVQARSNVTCTLLHPGSEPGMHDVAQLTGHFELKRLRRGTPMVLTRMRFDHDDGVECESFVRKPIDPTENPMLGVGLLRGFGSKPQPEIVMNATIRGFVSVEVGGNQLGKQSAVSCVLGHVTHNIGSIFAQENDRHFWCRKMVRAPVEVLIHDVLVFDEMFGPIKPRTLVYSDVRVGDSAIAYEDSEKLHLGESVVHLGNGPAILRSAEVPQYPEMIEHTCQRLGWDESRFHVYRCRIEYPIMPSSSVIEFDLPEKPR